MRYPPETHDPENTSDKRWEIMQSGLRALSCGCWSEENRDNDGTDSGPDIRPAGKYSIYRTCGFHRGRSGTESIISLYG
ncbi:MAG: hypothetical protein AMXMBFR17_28000 [Candidatus Jettenia caeni]|nr:MAG: hypothetical protein JETCAE04_08790 [Candidatus Jettenia caeni]